VECVPNFSEGRDAETVRANAAAIALRDAAAVLDVSIDPDHNRSVVTFVAPVEAVVEAAVRGVECAVERIDLGRHAGVHPRIGAADVVPFVPLEGVTLEECAALAREAGGEIWRRLRVPVFFYEAAALRAERRNLAEVRRGPLRDFDVGGPGPHPTAGASAVGARGFLIAFNVNLATGDVELARRIARRIRGSSGGFPFVKAMGVALASRGLVQVSMNLVDFERTPVEEVYAAIAREAPVAECELIGLVPRRAYRQAPRFYERAVNFHAGRILENRIEAV
jgi:glutamate formiminotransferase